MTALRTFAASLALLGAALACTTLPQPTPAGAERVRARWPEVSARDLERGRELYAGRCATCHQLYDPGSYGAEHWELEVAEMSERAKLDAAEQRAILQYLVSVAAPAPKSAGSLTASPSH